MTLRQKLACVGLTVFGLQIARFLVYIIIFLATS